MLSRQNNYWQLEMYQHCSSDTGLTQAKVSAPKFPVNNAQLQDSHSFWPVLSAKAIGFSSTFLPVPSFVVTMLLS